MIKIAKSDNPEQIEKLSAEALIPGGSLYERYQPEAPVQIHCNGQGYSYILKNALYLKELHSNKRICKLTLATLNKLLKEEGLKKIKQFPPLHFLKEKEHCCQAIVQNKIIFIDYRQQKIFHQISIDEKWKNFDFNEKKELFAYTCGNSLYLLFHDGKTKPVSVSKSKAITAGQAASRNEFGIEKGTFWSPCGRWLAYYVTDEKGVKNYPLVHIEDPIATSRQIKYPMAGQKSQKVSVWIYDVDSKENYPLQTFSGETDNYLTCITWSPNGENIYLAELARDQKHYVLKRFSAKTGKLDKTLFAESDKKYIEPQHPLFFTDETDDFFIWQSRKDGYNHLYLYDRNGKLIHQLTRGKWEVTQLVGYNKNYRQILFLSTIQSPLNRNACAVNIDSGEITVLTPESGTHQIFLAKDSSVFIDHFDFVESPGVTWLRTLPKGEIIQTIHAAENPYTSHLMPETEIGSIRKNENSPELYYRIVRPKKIDRHKKYPVVFYVYGGSHVQLIRDEWLAGTKGFEYLMANAGYVVFSIDPRGSANRGKDFEDCIWRDIGKYQLEDYLFSMEWLFSTKKYTDKNRAAVYGWSFGGFMSATLMLKAPGLFKAGVAGVAVTDWAFYEVMYTERYMETPTQNSAGYKSNNLRNFTNNLTGDLLLIHCDNDPVVLWQNTLSLVQSFIRAKKQVDYFVFPGHEHNVQGKDRVYLMLKIKKFIEEKLKNKLDSHLA